MCGPQAPDSLEPAIAGQNVQTVLRLVSLVLLVGGLALMGADVITSMDKGGEPYVRSIAQVWQALGPQSLGAFQGWARAQAPWLNAGSESLLTLWGWAVVGGLGVLLSFVAGRLPARH